MPRYFVTGATGFVGSHLVEACKNKGIETVTIARPSSDVTWPTQFGCQIHRGDLADPELVRKAMEGCDVVIHCAAKVGDWGPVEEYRQANVGTLSLLLETARILKVKRFIHISSLGVYEAKDHFDTDESTPPPAKHIDGYTQTKVEAETVANTFYKNHQVPVTILRPGFIYGPRDRTVLPKLLDNLKLGRVRFLGSGEQQMNTIHVLNLIDAIFLAINNPASIGQTYNLTDDEVVTKKVFIETVANAANLPKPTRHIPLGVAKTLATIVEGTARLMGAKKAPFITQGRIKFLGLNLGYSCEKAKKELGYAPRMKFQSSMPEAVAWSVQQTV